MTLSRNNWLVKLYKANFENPITDSIAPMDTNLCHFCRVVFLWLPLKVLFLLFIVVSVLVMVLYFFFVLVPDASWILHWILWGMITFGVILWYLADNYKTPAEMLIATVDAMPSPPKFVSDFTTVVWSFVKAKKQKICPLVKIEN